LKFRPAAMAASASKATKATAQGSTVTAPRGGIAAAAPAVPVAGMAALPTGVPQRWQKLAASESGAPHAAQKRRLADEEAEVSIPQNNRERQPQMPQMTQTASSAAALAERRC